MNYAAGGYGGLCPQGEELAVKAPGGFTPMGVYHAPVGRDYHALRCFQGYKLRHRRLSCKGLSNCFAINCTRLPLPEHGLERF